MTRLVTLPTDVGVHRNQVSAVADWRGDNTLKGNDLSSAPLFVVNRASDHADSRQWCFS